jgi:predicted amidohydrolase YtcJ
VKVPVHRQGARRDRNTSVTVAARMIRGALSPAGLAALSLDTPSRAAGFGDEVTRDRRGRPTGEVWEAAYGIALQRALADTAAQRGEQGAVAVLAAEADRCLAYGITHVHDPYVSPDWHQRMLALQATSPTRLSWATGSPAGMLSRPPGPATAPDGPYGDADREVKLFADGGERAAFQLPSRAVVDLFAGACAEAWRMHGTGPLREALRRKVILRPRHLHTPYLRYTDAELTQLMAAYAAAGMRLRIHALGNLAVTQAARALRTAGIPPGTATIDHLLLLDQATADLVAACGASASYQPGFIPRYGDMIAATRTTRHLTAFGARLLLRAGVPLALSSDHPPGVVDPLHNLRAAIHRRAPSGRALQPEQALTESEAVRAATVAAAASLGLPDASGLAAGQPADLVVCDGDPFQPETRVIQTWVAGRPAWRTPDQPVSHRR